MDNFEEYLRQGEPNKAEKAKVWKTAIGLQQVDGLKPSDYLITTARQNIEGDISFEEVKQRIDSYYEQHPVKDTENRTEEADKVSARIAEILSEQAFTFSPAEYLSIHRRLFQGIYSHAGKMRDYNIIKQEWILNGETVLYASALSLKATLEYDFEQEKKFNFKGLSQPEIIEHIAHFISYVWQIHIFGEGNTRTTAIFLIKYLRKLGFKEVNNEMFAEHSWYFRNALVRANYEDLSKGIHKTEIFLIRFLSNLLLGQNHSLKNRDMHVQFVDTVNVEIDTVNDTVNDTVFNLIKQNTTITSTEISRQLRISLSTAKRRIKELKERGQIERIGSDKAGHWKIVEK
jgi:fido (protein-threonine AMPylation protein)/ribosomal protein S25